MRLLLLAFVLLLFLAVGCSGAFEPVKPVLYWALLPNNDTPTNAMVRFVQSYERKFETEYKGMLTGDFTFEFSSVADPTLVQQYSTGWFKPDEIETSSHLFAGYTPPGEQTLQPASSISIRLALLRPTDDSARGVDPKKHKVLSTRVDGSVTVPRESDTPRTYVIFNNYDTFYLVRGDAALSLDSSQPADSTHWYIYRWVDLTAKADSSSQSDTVTWGALKGKYH